MTNEAKEIPITCTPQKLAQLVVKVDRGGGSLLVDAKGEPVAVTGQIVHTVRAWLVEQIEAGYHAGVEAGRAEATPAPTDAAAESAAIDGLVNEAVRRKGIQINAHDRTGRWRFSLGDTFVDDLGEVARAWLRPWLLAAWARGVAHGQQPGAPPVLADSFGVAAREQVAAERAADAAAVAPSEEALARARTEGAVEAFRKVAEWCQTAVPDGIDLDASIVEEVAKDAIGTLQHAAGAGDEKVREEGRRLGWKEAIAAVMRAHDAERRDVKRATDVAREMRKEADHAEDTRSRLALRAVATGNVLDAVIAAAPKEAP